MALPNVITLTTDFGHQGGYVGALKGVIVSINPKVRIVDITHEIGPQNISEGAFTLLVNYRYFPKNTVHVAVVDPGVGSNRKIICAKTPSGVFIGPDNGIFSPILEREGNVEVYEISNPKVFLPVISNTFHGRDKMAPAAAHVSNGFAIEKLGPKLSAWKRTHFDVPVLQKDSISGKIINIDRFGNLITNITGEDIRRIGSQGALSVRIKNKRIPKMVRFFNEVPKGELLAIIGSSNFVEIAKNLGSAQSALKARINDPVKIQKVKRSRRG